ncbi:hypothetical protein [Streptomyces mirabilis]|uniref:hypothetical protein n=1 Tax=Streptomyces mirabilis TaxID=68239 RepID=UPI0036C13885
MNEAAARLIKAIVQRREERAAQVIAVGAATSGTDLDRFSHTIEDSPELLALLSETVQAAMQTSLEDKVVALGRCLANGVEDDTRIDAERLRVRGLARIETQEAKIMAVLGQPQNPDGRSPWTGWNRAEILARLPGYVDVLDASMALLVAEGLAADAGVGGYGGGGPGREQWNLTDFGQNCLRLLQAVTPTGQQP